MTETARAGSRRDDTRTRILDAARELFATIGFDATTVRQIAERVEITDAALYYHFKSKREILNSVWDVPLGRSVMELRADGPLTPERLDEITDAAVDFSVTNQQLMTLICREILSGDQTALALRLNNRAILRRSIYENIATIAPAEEAEIRTEAAMALLTGSTMKLQIETGQGFAAAAASPEFRGRLRKWVRRIAQVPEPAEA